MEDLDDDFEDDDDDDEEDEEMFVPLMNMKKWIENKPSGFGEGKVYDTSIEDNLLEEMLQSREAQLANINKLKNSPKMLLPINRPIVHLDIRCFDESTIGV
ncbi:unnamed protein product [Camellia sinensis]